jgi:S1-C subfamily serine protease
MRDNSIVWISHPQRVQILIDGAPACFSQRALSALAAKLGPEHFAIFADASLEEGRVVWRARSRSTGFETIGNLGADDRARFAEHVKRPLAALSELVNDPEVGHVAAAMLTVEAPEALLWNGAQAAVAGWGGWPPGIRNAADAHALFERTVGPFVPLRAPPVIPTGQAEIQAEPLIRRLRVPLAAALGGLLLLATFAWPGVLRVVQSSVSPAVEISPPPAEMNQALRGRIEEYRALLGGNVCPTAGPRRALVEPPSEPGGSPPDRPETPPPSGAPLSPEPPINPYRTELTDTPGPSTPQDPVTLAAHLERATVFIINSSEESTSIGSGFFVAKDRVLTNAHVVGDVGGRVLLGSRAMGKLIPAVVEFRTPTAAAGKPDFALLRTAGYESPVQLGLTVELQPRQPVVAVGYPSIILATDAAFQRLKRTGDPSAIPETVFSDGTVMVIQNRESALPLIHHLALISEGNSGGPLADACGRVVGVNSFIAHSASGAHANVSLGSAAAASFLRQHGMQIEAPAGRCRTSTAETSTQPPITPNAPTPPPSGGTPPASAPNRAVPLRAPFESPFSAGRPRAEIRKACDVGRT